MKTRNKIIVTISSMCLVAAIALIGVFAFTTQSFTISNRLQFTASQEIDATVVLRVYNNNSTVYIDGESSATIVFDGDAIENQNESITVPNQTFSGKNGTIRDEITITNTSGFPCYVYLNKTTLLQGKSQYVDVDVTYTLDGNAVAESDASATAIQENGVMVVNVIYTLTSSSHNVDWNSDIAMSLVVNPVLQSMNDVENVAAINIAGAQTKVLDRSTVEITEESLYGRFVKSLYGTGFSFLIGEVEEQNASPKSNGGTFGNFEANNELLDAKKADDQFEATSIGIKKASSSIVRSAVSSAISGDYLTANFAIATGWSIDVDNDGSSIDGNGVASLYVNTDYVHFVASNSTTGESIDTYIYLIGEANSYVVSLQMGTASATLYRSSKGDFFTDFSTVTNVDDYAASILRLADASQFTSTSSKDGSVYPDYSSITLTIGSGFTNDMAIYYAPVENAQNSSYSICSANAVPVESEPDYVQVTQSGTYVVDNFYACGFRIDYTDDNLESRNIWFGFATYDELF